MDAETFLENFATIANAPGGVSRLRDLVLDLAVSGCLVATHADTDGWPTRTLGEVARLRRGFDLPVSQRVKGSVPVFGANGPVGSHDSTPLVGPGVLTGRSGSIGLVRYVDGPYWPLNTSLYVEDFFGNDPRWVTILLQGVRLKRFSSFSAVPTLNRNVVHREPVLVPPRGTQETIVAKVDELMGLCDELEACQVRRRRVTGHLRDSALHALTEAERSSDLLHAWARVSASWPALVDNADGIPAFRAAILDLAFRGRLVTQDRGDGSAAVLLPADHSPIKDPPYAVPSTWEWARFDEVAESRLGKMLDKAKNVGPLRPYLRNANVQWFRFDLGDIHELRLEDKEYEAHSLRTGDLVICEGGEPGRAAVCDAAVEGMVFQKALHRARPRQGVEVWYLAHLMESTAANGRLARYFTGATIKHLSGRSLGTFPVPLPPADEQKRIVAVIECAFRKCDDIEQRLRVRDDIAERLAASATAQRRSSSMRRTQLLPAEAVVDVESGSA